MLHDGTFFNGPLQCLCLVYVYVHVQAHVHVHFHVHVRVQDNSTYVYKHESTEISHPNCVRREESEPAGLPKKVEEV